MAESVHYETFLQPDTGTHHSPIVQIVATPDGQSLVSAGETTMRVWNVQTRNLDRLLLGQVAGPTDDSFVDGAVQRMALSPDGRWIVALKPWRRQTDVQAASPYTADPVGARDAERVTEVQVFELATGNLQARFVHASQLLDLGFSPDGRWLAVAGHGRRGKLRGAFVALFAARDVLKAGFRTAPRPVASKTIGPARAAAAIPVALRFVPASPRARDPMALVVALNDPVTGRGTLNWLHFERATGLRRDRASETAIAIVPSTLAVSHDLTVVAAGPLGGRKRHGQLLWQDHAGRDGGEITAEAPPASTAFSPSGDHLIVGLSADIVGGIVAAPGDQTVQVNAYAVLPYGGLELCSTYYGHDGSVGALTFLGDDTAVSAGGDNHAIHLWHFRHRVGAIRSAIRGVGRNAFAPGITANERVQFGTVPARLRPPRHPERQQSFDLRRMRLLTTSSSDVRRSDYESRKWFIVDNDAQIIPLRYSPDAYGTEMDLPPDLSLFVGADDEWVIWSRCGYYNASPNGAQRIGYRVNRGIAKEALFIPSDRFKVFYRPDIIDAIVKHGSEARARAKGVDIPPVDAATILPPIVELTRHGLQVADGQVTFSFTIECTSPNYPVTRVWILRNDRFVWVEPKPSPALHARYSVTLPLLPGPNLFSIKAENIRARSVPVVHRIAGPVPTGADEQAFGAPGHLFLLSVGVSDFAVAGTDEAGPFERLRFAHQDATAVFNAFARSKPARTASQPLRGPMHLLNRAFDGVEATLLVNAEATKSRILHELDKLCARIRERSRQPGAERDVLFVFLSGHGVRFKGEPDLYFWNFDLRPSAMEATGLSMLDLGDRITSVPAEVVLVVDACHSAMAGSNVMSGLDAEELARRVHAINERGMYLMNASRADELAREDATSGMGVLTSAMLAALSSNRFLVPDGPGGKQRSIGMVGLIAGVQQLVPQISARAGTEAQTPVCRIYGDLLPLTIYKT